MPHLVLLCSIETIGCYPNMVMFRCGWLVPELWSLYEGGTYRWIVRYLCWPCTVHITTDTNQAGERTEDWAWLWLCLLQSSYKHLPAPPASKWDHQFSVYNYVTKLFLSSPCIGLWPLAFAHCSALHWARREHFHTIFRCQNDLA